MDSATQTSEGE